MAWLVPLLVRRISSGRKKIMKLRALLLVAALVACLMPFAFGQGSTSPAQPQDPTAQSPAANPPATPKTFPDSTSASPSSSQSQPADQSGSQPSSPTSSSQSSSQSTDQGGAQAGSTAGTTSSSSSATSTDNKNSFTGSIVKNGSKYQLRSGGTDYDLDDQSQAKSFEGKDVKVNGSLDKSSNTIKVTTIEPASPMQ
jgi:Protein of unknown function (DUF5818)